MFKFGGLRTGRYGFVGLAVVLLGACSEPAKSEHPAQSEELYYNLSDDPDFLQLLGLWNISNEGGKDYITVFDLYRGELTQGLISTWEIDCPRERMRIVKNMAFTPDGTGDETEIDGEVVAARSSPTSWTIYKLVCEGSGQLVERQVYRQPLEQIITNFWGME